MRRPAWWWPVPVAVAAVTLLVVVPVVELALVAADAGWPGAVEAFDRAGAGTAAVNTLWTAAIATPVAVAIGTAAAVTTERLVVPGHAVLRAGVLLTLLVPSFVAAQSWARAYGPSGLTDDLVGITIPGVYGPAGVVTVLILNAVPLAYLVVAGGLSSRAEPDLDRAAAASGASGWQTLGTVTLPLLRPALVAAAAIVFTTGVNAFGIPVTLGLPGGFSTLTTRIYRDLAFAADPAAFTRVVVLAVTLVVLALVVVTVADALGALRPAATRTGAPPGAAPTGRPRWGPAIALWSYLLLTTGVPLLALLLTAITRGVGLPPVPANWTLDNFGEALAGQTAGALGNSLMLAVAAASIVVALGGLLVGVRYRRLGRPLGTAATLTFAVPGSALAVAVLLAYGSWLRDTLTLILVAYVAKFLALGHRTVTGAVDGLPPELSHAARISGAGPRTALATVTVPLLRPALVGAWLLVFVIAVHELTMSALLYGQGTATLAVAILNVQQLGDLAVTSALAVLLTGIVVFAALPLLLLGWGGGRSRRGTRRAAPTFDEVP